MAFADLSLFANNDVHYGTDTIRDLDTKIDQLRAKRPWTERGRLARDRKVTDLLHQRQWELRHRPGLHRWRDRMAAIS